MKRLLKIIFTIFILFLVLTGCSDSYIILYESKVTNLSQYFNVVPSSDPLDSKYLVLVNKDNLFNEEYLKDIKLVDIYDIEGEKHQIEKETNEHFIKLQKALQEKDITIGIQASYRSMDDQKLIWDTYMVKYGEVYTRKYAAVPGSSEHHTGLAIDIAPKIGDSWEAKPDELYLLNQNYEIIHSTLHEYGFILRYPKGKESITGYEYEPWHIRYVGKETATEIYNKDLTLEEYINSFKK